MKSVDEMSFQQNVIEAFSFLVEKYSFMFSVETDDMAVVFTNGQITLRIFCERGSCMTYVEVCRKDTGEEYLLHEILHALAPDETLSPQCSVADSTKAEKCLSQLSHLCSCYLQGIIAMDEATFAAVRKTATEMRRQYTLEAQYGAIKLRANLAWEHHDWNKARELYEMAKPGLSIAELRRLDFLRNRNDKEDSQLRGPGE